MVDQPTLDDLNAAKQAAYIEWYDFRKAIRPELDRLDELAQASRHAAHAYQTALDLEQRRKKNEALAQNKRRLKDGKVSLLDLIDQADPGVIKDHEWFTKSGKKILYFYSVTVTIKTPESAPDHPKKYHGTEYLDYRKVHTEWVGRMEAWMEEITGADKKRYNFQLETNYASIDALTFEVAHKLIALGGVLKESPYVTYESKERRRIALSNLFTVKS